VGKLRPLPLAFQSRLKRKNEGVVGKERTRRLREETGAIPANEPFIWKPNGPILRKRKVWSVNYAEKGN
jgi:hypothetical protein